MSLRALERLAERFGPASPTSTIRGTHSLAGDDTAIIDAEKLLEVITFLKDDPELYFDMLVDLTAIDTLALNAKTAARISANTSSPTDAEGQNRFYVVYHLRSMKTGKRLRIKAGLADSVESGDSPDHGGFHKLPAIDSLSSLYRSANWAERETYDMYGIRFRGHPDLRRLLMYEEFVGHPLRKDYPKEKRQPLVRRDFS